MRADECRVNHSGPNSEESVAWSVHIDHVGVRRVSQPPPGTQFPCVADRLKPAARDNARFSLRRSPIWPSSPVRLCADPPKVHVPCCIRRNQPDAAVLSLCSMRRCVGAEVRCAGAGICVDTLRLTFTEEGTIGIFFERSDTGVPVVPQCISQAYR